MSSFKVENLQLLHYNKGQIPGATSSSATGKALTHPESAVLWLLGISQYFDIYSFSCHSFQLCEGIPTVTPYCK